METARPHSSELTDLTLEDTGKLLASGQISPVDLVEESLTRIERFNTSLNAFITVTADLARTRAAEAQERISKGGYLGRLDGIPFALKDNFETKGVLSTSHSKLLCDNIPEEDSFVADRLAQSGAILLGKTSTFEFALGGPSWDLPWPPALNPWNVKHFPGGSSSGSAAAVSARIVPMAMGTDTSGSVRWPAAVCGLVGLKPTYGRISRRGVHPNTFSIDHCGPLTRTVVDCAIVMNTVAGFDRLDPGSIDEPVPDYREALNGSVQGLRVGLVRDWYADDATDDVVVAVDACAERLAELGCIVEEVEFGSMQEYIDCKTTISMAELFAIHEYDLKTRPQDYGKSLRTRIIAGGLVRGEDYVQALRLRAELCKRMFKHFTRFDVFVTAGWLNPAEPADPNLPDFFKHRKLVTLPFSLTGIPAVVLPCGFSADGLPLSVQIAGKPFDEATILKLAHSYQASTEWHLRRPTVS